MNTRSSENAMSTLTRTWPSPSFFIILIIATATATSAADGAAHNDLRLLLSSNPALIHHDMTSSVIPIATVSGAPTTTTSAGTGELPKSRKVREISGSGGEDELSSASAAALGQDFSQSRQTSKAKALYPTLSGSGELFRLFRPLALTPDKTIGMTRWYLPGFGYFNRGGRAASSNFIRFGRSGRFAEEDDGLNGGGDTNMQNRNNAKKKNNFIRLGRENPRTTNFIRLGRSGPPSAGEFFNSGYVTPALSDPFRDEEDGRHEMI